MNDRKEPEVAGQPATDGPCARLGAEIDRLLGTFGPPEEVCQHFTNARIEILRGLRAIVDARIERLSSEGRKGASVTIE